MRCCSSVISCLCSSCRLLCSCSMLDLASCRCCDTYRLCSSLCCISTSCCSHLALSCCAFCCSSCKCFDAFAACKPLMLHCTAVSKAILSVTFFTIAVCWLILMLYFTDPGKLQSMGSRVVIGSTHKGFMSKAISSQQSTCKCNVFC